MPDHFDKFTDQARQALALAQEEAKRSSHEFIGTEHLLLGLIREGHGVAARVLTKTGISLPQARSVVDFILRGSDQCENGGIGLTPRATTVIQLAIEEAHRLDHSSVGTEHLLLGIIREGEGVATGVLESLGVDLAKLSQEVIACVEAAENCTPELSMGGASERISERALTALALAQEEARVLNHNYIGTEHLLIGLVRDHDGVAGVVLDRMGIELLDVRGCVEFIVGRGDGPVPHQLKLTPRCRKVVEIAVEEASRLNHTYIGTGHLLLGLILEGEGLALAVLERLNVDIEQLRQRVTQLIID